MKIIGILAVALALSASLWAATPVRISPYNGPCEVESVTPATMPSVSTFTASGVGIKRMIIQNRATTDVALGFDVGVSTITGYLFDDIGDQLQLDINENTKLYFIGQAAGGSVRVLTCE